MGMMNAGMMRGKCIGSNMYLAKKPHFTRKLKEVIEHVEPDYIVTPPRSIPFGVMINEFTGEEGDVFHLPFDSASQEPSIALIGAPGTGKTVAATRLIDEIRHAYGRSVLIFDSKNQYINMNKPNQDPVHVEILKKHGEKPRGCGEMEVYLPYHVYRKEGKEQSELMYNFTNTWQIRTQDIEAIGLLMLGNKALSDRDYINVLAAVVDQLKVEARENGTPFTIDSLLTILNNEKEGMSAKKRSVDTLLVMIDNLVKSGVIADNGNNVLELFHEPRISDGKVVIFNTSAASPDDIQTKGLITNMIGAACQELKLHIDRKTKIPKYQPIFVIEEASIYYGKKSDRKMLDAFNNLQNVMGRSAAIMRVYIYQFEEQAAEGLFTNDNMRIIIRLKQSITLRNGRQISGKGYAQVSIRNVSFMHDADYLIRVLPPKCEIGS